MGICMFACVRFLTDNFRTPILYKSSLLVSACAKIRPDKNDLTIVGLMQTTCGKLNQHDTVPLLNIIVYK